MSEGYEKQDATLFAQWKIDMLKIDNCGVHETPHLLGSGGVCFLPTLLYETFILRLPDASGGVILCSCGAR